MQRQVVLVTCPRCGKEYVREAFGIFENIERYTKNSSDFKPVPDSWLYIEELGGHLCPGCSLAFKERIAQFMYLHEDRVVKRWRLDDAEIGE